ncbi:MULTISPECIES: MFS transporter [unclassified Streptomyces]|uniref:MFS transporter n=1 Tax=unclassified Streptomyces TaxID=2593676 RepID=UPI002DD7F11D|nr:MFS transporter [Streptomyces sp. NBC_00385]WRZ02588.1 MHS family MFS transporter [Streptomyces sp. NBC_00385]
MTHPAPPATERRQSPLRIATATLIGTSVEWYDFGIYSTAAALVFPKLFFPDMSPALGVLSSFATLAVGSLGRPVGAILFGHIGDRYGRKRALIGSLLLMGVSTFLIGVLPSYAVAGGLAPALLLLIRITQSLAVGGEWGGAVLYAVENAPPGRKALYGSFPQIGDGIGFFLATGAFTLAALPGHDALLAWTWRIPFLLSSVLVLTGLIIRTQLEESPEIKEALRQEKEGGDLAGKLPLLNVARSSWRTWLLAIGAFLITIGGFYVIVTFMSAYAVAHLGFTDAETSAAGMFASVVVIVFTPLTALLADRYGVRRITLIGMSAHLVVAFPMFWLAGSQSVVGLWAGMGLGMLASTIAYATVGTMISEWFPPRIRYTGLSLGYQIAGLLGGGIVPPLAQWLAGGSGASWTPVAVLFAVMTLISIVCVLAYRPDTKTGTTTTAATADTLLQGTR